MQINTNTNDINSSNNKTNYNTRKQRIVSIEMHGEIKWPCNTINSAIYNFQTFYINKQKFIQLMYENMIELKTYNKVTYKTK